MNPSGKRTELPSDGDADSVRELVREFLARRRREPGLTPASFAAGHPEAPKELGTLLLRAMEEPAAEGERTLQLGDAARRPAESGSEPSVQGDATLLSSSAVIDARYEVVRTLGQGGFGRVHLVRDRLYGQELRALKTVLPEHSAKPAFAARFQNEIRVLRALAHAGIPQIFNDGKTLEGEFYYTMAFVEGRTLAEVLRKEAPLRPDRVVALVRQMLEILAYAHGKGVVHRDLKPANIMLVDAGASGEQVKILDFGIAKVQRPEGELQGALTQHTIGGIGTPHYMSPEQVRGKDVDERTDLYALGIIIYQMCSGAMPFSGKTDLEVAAARLEQTPTPLDNESTPRWLRGVVDRLLEREKEKRPSTRELAAQFERLAHGQRELRGGLRRLSWAGLALALVVVAFFVQHNVKGGNDSPHGRDLPPSPLTALTFSLRDGQHVVDPVVRLAGRAPGRAHVEIQGQSVPVIEGSFSCEVALKENAESLISYRDTEGESAGELHVVVDTKKPTIEVRSPEATILPTRRVVLEGRVYDESPGRLDPESVVLDGSPLELGPGDTFVQEVDLGAEGKRIHLEARDLAGNLARRELPFSVDETPPTLELDRVPGEVETVWVALKGDVVDAHPKEVRVIEEGEHAAGREPGLIECGPGGTFETRLDLAEGENRFRLVALDAVGHSVEKELLITRRVPSTRIARSGLPDAPISAGTRSYVIKGQADRSVGRVTVNGADAVIEGEQDFHLEVALAEGANPVEIVPYDKAGRRGESLNGTIHRQRALVPAGCKALGEEVDDAGRPKKLVHEATGITLVLIPEASPELSRGTTSIKAFYLGLTEVTRQEYQRLGRAPASPSFDVLESQPVVNVSFSEALDFCRRSGLRLPLAEEWEYAARGPQLFQYPWGNDWAPDRCRNAAQGPGTGPAEVERFPLDESAFGVRGLAGNVSEWCRSSAEQPSVCGGSYSSDEKGCNCASSSTKRPPTGASEFIGFRIALDAP